MTEHPLAARTRRHFLSECGVGLGGIALASLAGAVSAKESADALGRRDPLAPRPPHFAPRAKRVIHLHMAGSPPTLDLFDPKPDLVRRTGEECPASFLAGKQFAFTSGTPKLLGSPRRFRRVGGAGTWVSDALPSFGEVADDVCVVRSVHTDQFNHAPAQLMLLTGSPRVGRPTLGSWATWGLGSEAEDLPAYVVLVSGGSNPSAGKTAWGSGFLPSVFQGVQCRSAGDPVLFVSDPAGMSRGVRRAGLDAIADLNAIQHAAAGDPETLTRTAQYELAFRMQASVPGVMDLADEPRHVLDRYGAEPGAASFANNCLLARRLVERGTRFVQLFDWGWDFHGTGPREGLTDGLTDRCRPMDRAYAALLTDLKQRGLLDDTLVIWGGEFGRTPFREGRTAKGAVLGRDHYPDCYTVLLAGGGVKPGHTHGATDALGFGITEDPVHVHDLQATVLHLLGFDHERMTYRHQGRDFRLTDVHGAVVRGVLA